jgi:hypothetical protein
MPKPTLKQIEHCQFLRLRETLEPWGFITTEQPSDGQTESSLSESDVLITHPDYPKLHLVMGPVMRITLPQILNEIYSAGYWAGQKNTSPHDPPEVQRSRVGSARRFRD